MKNIKFSLLIVFLLCFVFIFFGCNSETYDKQNPPESTTKANIEVIDWVNRLSDPPIYYYVEGILKNTGNKTADFVKVKITAYDIDDKLVSLNDTFADPYTVAPNQEATFQVMVEYDSKIERFKINVIWQ